MSAADSHAHRADTEVLGVPVFFANRILRIDSMGPCAQFTLGVGTDEPTDRGVAQLIIIWPTEGLPGVMTMLAHWLLMKAARCARAKVDEMVR